MARKLNKKQIEIIKSNSGAFDWEELPEEVQQKLVDLNDYETLWSDVNRFLDDFAWQARRSSTGD